MIVYRTVSRPFRVDIDFFVVFQSGMDSNVAAGLNEDAGESKPAVAVSKSEDHKKLLEYGIHELVADRLDEIYTSGEIVILLV